MPVLDTPGNVGPDAQPAIGGFSRQQIIEIANRRTERRGTSLDLNAELLLALQEFTLERRWWWRRRTVQFTLQAGVSQYDLTEPDTINAFDFQQVARGGVKVFPPTTVPPTPVPPGTLGSCRFHALDAVFEVDVQDQILVTQNQFPPAMPAQFFMVPGASYLMMFNPIPDAAYPVIVAFWAVPNWTYDSIPETIPLIPGYAQMAVVKRLEMAINKYTLGEGSEKYESSAQEYQAMLDKLSLYGNFADGQVRDIRSHHHEDAVQSTR
jgi:hypothetical protein